MNEEQTLKEVTKWAEAATNQELSVFGFMNAARVFPHISAIREAKLTNSSRMEIKIIRALIVSAVSGTRDDNFWKNLSSRTSQQCKSVAHDIEGIFKTPNFTLQVQSRLANDAALCASFAALAGQGYAGSVHFTESTIATDEMFAVAPILSTLNLITNHSPKYALENGLWLDGEIPHKIDIQWQLLKAAWRNEPSMHFWVDWYEGLLAGSPPNWGLWKQIALIDDSFWQQGPEAIAKEIELLQAAGDLSETIEHFESQLLHLASEPIFEGNSHNGGPPLNELPTRKEAIELIRVQLDILKAERDKLDANSEEEPDPQAISTAVEKIVLFVKKHLVACLISGAVVTGALNKVGADMVEHYHVSETIFQSVDDLVESSARFIEKLKARPNKSTNPRPNSPPIDL